MWPERNTQSLQRRWLNGRYILQLGFLICVKLKQKEDDEFPIPS